MRERKLRDEPRTLESLGEELGLSKERVRQLEAAAFGKMRKSLEAQSRGCSDFLPDAVPTVALARRGGPSR